jgi:protein-L-isoaspartate(D-aspartate) O-methyltransferase
MTEDKYFISRKELIETLKRSGIKADRVLDVMQEVPRHEFISGGTFSDPYENAPQPIGFGQTISQPYIVALMTQYLKLKGDEKVLEIGTGCGYQTAILCEMAKEVYSVERIPALRDKSIKNLDKLGYKNYQICLSDGTEGWEEFAPYDAIIVTAASPEVPEPLKEQLVPGGRLVIPVGKGSTQDLLCITRNIDSYITEYICGVCFVPLVGKYGWDK